jgi:tryptophan halogenase
MKALQRMSDLRSRLGKDRDSPLSIRRIVIVGGGSAGWMAAAALSNSLGPSMDITLVESEQIGTVGVGEATIPTIRLLNHTMGVDEREFLRQTQGTFKLGIQFVNWGKLDHQYFHPFGFFGMPFDAVPVHQHWLKHRNSPMVGTLDDYSLASIAAKLGRFSPPTVGPGELTSSFNYAFHFDASLYAKYLRGLSEGRGVRRVEGIISDVRRDPRSGHVASLLLSGGAEVSGDLFIDCSGFSSLLLGQALGVEYESWSRWLPCDRAWAMPCTLEGAPVPYTRSTALEAGWQWTIPLRHRVGNGYVFSSAYVVESKAEEILRGRLPGKALGEPRLLKFTAGRRHKAWEANVVALGLASGFLEPLESTSLHLVHSGLSVLLSMFPDKTFSEPARKEYNRRFAMEMERIRDFLILHYTLNQRDDGEMWRYCSQMPLPDSLQERMELFHHCGQLQLDHADLFGAESWLAVHLGQFNFPQTHFPMLDIRRADGLTGLRNLRKALLGLAQSMPSHEAFIKQYLSVTR